MDYNLERLGPENFQKLCQALLTREYPDVQCWPVGQPDGGRDIVRYHGRNDFIVYQVKFVREPQALKNPRKWLLNQVGSELPKLAKLLKRGASAYVLVTNVGASGHLESGSLDKMQGLLDEKIPIPAQCWWRDDIERKLDSSGDIRWAFPQLVTGADILNLVFQAQHASKRNALDRTIRAFLRTQYDEDEQVKFKQVELQNNLMDLFIDVPLQMPDPEDPDANSLVEFLFHVAAEAREETELFGLWYEHETLEPDQARRRMPHWGRLWRHYAPALGVSEALLNRHIQAKLHSVVLEGAPGQGKSTIAQYICQVHRMRLLARTPEAEELPPHYRSAPIRLPIKVDLRDLASWWNRKNPFSPGERVPSSWHRTIESFLATLISVSSGGASFTVDDLHAILAESSALLVFDGLDEVANLDARKDLATAIVKTRQRLSEVSQSLQIIVTSRPAALADSPVLPAPFLYLQLGSVTESLAQEYAERWVKARRLDQQQKDEVRNIFREKLKQPHIRDLARNPMQLTILLSLVHTRGASLPEKRTALYQNYVELFFNREAEKSQIVREHRNLLIDVHQYLGWKLHTRAEEDNGAGSLTAQQLTALVSQYLRDHGHENVAVSDLLLGIQERVVALVSRVEGTYEFEVQPLREYFAAAFLYNTAPYTPVGEMRSGTKPDRFRALARRPYWQNVTRFFAGFLSQGELPMLVHELGKMATSKKLSLTTYPRKLTVALLSDWVFTQYPNTIQEVIALLTAPPGPYLLASMVNRGPMGLLDLAEGCGQQEVVDEFFSLLANEELHDEVVQQVGLIIAGNITNQRKRKELEQRWHGELQRREGEPRERWLKAALFLRIIKDMVPEDVRRVFLMNEKHLSPKHFEILDQADRLDCINVNDSSYATAERFLFDGLGSMKPRLSTACALDLIKIAVNPACYSALLHVRGYSESISLSEMILERFAYPDLDGSERETWLKVPSDGSTGAVSFLASYEEEVQRSLLEWQENLEPWINVLEKGRAIYGERRALMEIAVIAAELDLDKEIRDTYATIARDRRIVHDPEIPLCVRSYLARRRSRSPKYWEYQLEHAAKPHERLMTLLFAFCWLGPRTRVRVSQAIDGLVSGLSIDDWHWLMQALARARFTVAGFTDRALGAKDVLDLPDSLSSLTASLLGISTTLPAKHKIFERYLGPNLSEQHAVGWQEALDLSLENLADAMESQSSWNEHLDLIRTAYKNGAASRFKFKGRLSLECAMTIMHDAADFPLDLVGSADAKVTGHQNRGLSSLAEAARSEGWFRTTRSQL